MLVACSLVNLTTWAQARGAFEWLRRRYIVPEVLAVASEESLHCALRPLGLWRRRSRSLVRLANAWLVSPPKSYLDVRKLPGCGRYAADSWAIFIEGRHDVEVTDGKLLWYLRELQHAQQRQAGRLGARPPV